MPEEINYKKIISKYIKNSEMFFPPDWSFSKNSLFRTFLTQIISDECKSLQEQNITKNEVDYILKTITNWCAWCYIDAEVLFLSDEHIEKMFQSIVHTTINTFIKCIKKEQTKEEYSDVIDQVIREKFEGIINVYMSKGIITNKQLWQAKLRNAKELSLVNVSFNEENNKILLLLISVMCAFCVIIPVITAFINKEYVFTSILVSVVLAIICYWIYMLILNWHLNRQNQTLIDLKGAGLSLIPKGTKSSEQTDSKGKGNIKPVNNTQALTVNKESQGHVSSTGIRSVITLFLGKGLLPYTEEYSEGMLPVLVAQLRNKIIKQYNVEIPPVEIKNYPNSGDYDYKIFIKRKEVLSGTLTSQNTLMEDLINQIENCIVKNIEDIKGWYFAKGTKPGDFSDDL